MPASKYLQVFLNRRMALMLLLGFSSGTPLPLIGGTLQAWLTDEGVDIKSIGLFTAVGIPFAYKFLWAPLMDTINPKLPGLNFGIRRKWMLITQIAILFLLLAISFSQPQANLTLVAFLAFLIGVSGASQDIVVDAYRTEFLTEEERGIGASIFILGYRLALIAGNLALVLADHVSWQSVYQIMAASMSIGLLATIYAPELKGNNVPKGSLFEVVRAAFKDLLLRNGAYQILLFVILYKLGDVMAAALTTRFMMDIGYSKSEIGVVAKSFGLVSTILGGLFGGLYLPKFGLAKALFVFGVLQAVSTLGFSFLAETDHNLTLMAACIGIENICNGMGTAAFIAFLMTICNKRFTATQYAVLTSLMAISRYLGGALTGYLVDLVGWSIFFVFCALSAAPGLLLLLNYKNWQVTPQE